MRFNEYRYLWPPRPEKAVPPSLLQHYADKGWLAQVKLNGTCSVLGITPDRKIKAMSRHKEPHKLWSPNAATERAFQNLPGDGWYIFIGELLHSKVADPKLRNIHYIHDVLVADGEHLVGTTYASRLALLSELLPSTDEGAISHTVVDANTWIAKPHYGNFDQLFQQTSRPKEMEGLVMKDPQATLKFCVKEDSNSSWQVKCRHPSKSYSF